MHEIKEHGSERKEEFRMARYIIPMRHKHFEFLWLSFKLRFALPCPEMTHEKDLKHRMP